jgi:hypothetical protein
MKTTFSNKIYSGVPVPCEDQRSKGPENASKTGKQFTMTTITSLFRYALSFILLLSIGLCGYAQLPKAAVIGVDVKVQQLEDQNLSELLRIELAKHNKFEVVDRYEVDDLLKKAGINPSDCYSKSCLVKAGSILGSDKVIAGNIDRLGESIYIRLRVIDVELKSVEKEVVNEFIILPQKINTMISISVNDIVGVVNDKMLVESLTSTESYESAVNNPHYNVLQLSGPRMGYAILTGEAAEIFKKPKSEGGYDGYPALFQFGYQFEKEYLNEGKFQALFEFIPMVSGLDQGLFIPSITVMNGLRNNVNGLEFAIGPSINTARVSTYYKDADGNLLQNISYPESEGLEKVQRMDSRGHIVLRSYVVIAAGFSLRSGKMNIPVNCFLIPSKSSTRFGFSFGFNSRG